MKQNKTSSGKIFKKAKPGMMIMLAGLAISPLAVADKNPKLVVQITVDALRADLPMRYRHVFGEGGFNFLLDQGTHFINARYQHANTETIVGHASLATGTTPARHGMIGNVWFDRQQGRLVYNIEDADYKLLTAGAGVDSNAEIDSTQKAAKTDGRSPENIISSTFSDEIAMHSFGRSKVFAVSVKDRGAVSLAGHAGKAFWFSKKTGEFVTSNYYYDKYPEWVNEWNKAGHVSAYAGRQWTLQHDSKKYLFGEADDREYETDFPGYGRVFPHSYGKADDKYFTTRLTLGPAGDTLTADFAKTLIDKEGLGKDEITDYLAVSFSSTDYVGHIFGPSSLESEDNLAHLDRTLADFFRFIDNRVGLENTLIVLSADHGQPEVPGYLHELGIKSAKYFDTESLDKTPAIARLKKQFGIGKELISKFFQPYIYLDHDVIKKHDLDLAEVQKAVADELLKFDGIAYAISSTDISENLLPATRLNHDILNNYHPKRSGDIYIVFENNVFVNDFDGLSVASTHGSPWNYDQHVPVIFAGSSIKAARVSRPVTPYDIASTLSAILGIKPPSASSGEPLIEVVNR